jgi:hypothetical protein
MVSQPILDVIHTADALEIIKRLSERFEVTPPTFRFNKSRRGLYYPAKQEVTIARPLKQGRRRRGEHSLLHEFAHHLADLRVRREYEAAGRAWSFKDLPHHDARFRRALLDITTFYYDGDPKRYVWDSEYPAIISWATRRGLVAPRRKSAWEEMISRSKEVAAAVQQPTLGFAVTKNGPYLTLGQVSSFKMTPAKKTFPPFDKVLTVEMWNNGARITDIVKAVHGGRALGNTGNKVRAALTEAGVYPRTETR